MLAEPTFYASFYRRYRQLRRTSWATQALLDRIGNITAPVTSDPNMRNQARWHNICPGTKGTPATCCGGDKAGTCKGIWPFQDNEFGMTTVGAHLQQVETFLQSRLVWMDQQLGGASVPDSTLAPQSMQHLRSGSGAVCPTARSAFPIKCAKQPTTFWFQQDDSKCRPACAGPFVGYDSCSTQIGLIATRWMLDFVQHGSSSLCNVGVDGTPCAIQQYLHTLNASVCPEVPTEDLLPCVSGVCGGPCPAGKGGMPCGDILPADATPAPTNAASTPAPTNAASTPAPTAKPGVAPTPGPQPSPSTAAPTDEKAAASNTVWIIAGIAGGCVLAGAYAVQCTVFSRGIWRVHRTSHALIAALLLAGIAFIIVRTRAKNQREVNQALLNG